MRSRLATSSRIYLVTLLAGGALATLPPARASADDVAVVVGVNQYTKLDNGSNLAGCVPDAKSVQATLKKMGFTVKLLTDSHATRQGIIDALKAARSSVKKSDRFVFYFAGHGTHDTAYKCFLLASDAEETNYTYTLSKEDLDKYISDIPTNKRTVLLDACHAEGLFRSKGLVAFRSRYHQLRVARNTPKTLPHVNETDNNDEIVASEFCGFAACLRRQPAGEIDFGDTTHGVFTYYLTEELDKNGKEATWDDVVTHVTSGVATKMESQQTPVFGPTSYRSRRVFDGADDKKVDPHPGPHSLWDDYTDIKTNRDFVLVTADPNSSSFKIPEYFHVNIKVGNDGYLILLNKDSSGKVYLFSPDPKIKDIDELVQKARVKKGVTRSVTTRAQDRGTELVKAILFRSEADVRELLSRFPRDGATEEALRRSKRPRHLPNDGENDSDHDKKEDKDWTYFTSQISVDILSGSDKTSDANNDDRVYGKGTQVANFLPFVFPFVIKPGEFDALNSRQLAILRRKPGLSKGGELHV